MTQKIFITALVILMTIAIPMVVAYASPPGAEFGGTSVSDYDFSAGTGASASAEATTTIVRVVGPQGPQGPAGKSIRGSQGPVGVSITAAWVVCEDLWISLSDGRQINAGKVKGPAGQTGIGIISAFTNQAGSLLITLSNGQVINAGQITPHNRDYSWLWWLVALVLLGGIVALVVMQSNNNAAQERQDRQEHVIVRELHRHQEKMADKGVTEAGYEQIDKNNMTRTEEINVKYVSGRHDPTQWRQDTATRDEGQDPPSSLTLPQQKPVEHIHVVRIEVSPKSEPAPEAKKPEVKKELEPEKKIEPPDALKGWDGLEKDGGIFISKKFAHNEAKKRKIPAGKYQIVQEGVGYKVVARGK